MLLSEPITTPKPLLVTVAQAASLLGISLWSMRRMAYSGIVASRKIGPRLLVPYSELERVAAEGVPTIPQAKPKHLTAKTSPAKAVGKGGR